MRRTPRGITTEAYRYHCRLSVLAPAAVIAEHLGPTIAMVTAVDDTRCEVTVGSNSLDEVALYVGLLGHEVVVLKPAELAAHFADVGSRLLRAAGASR